MKEPLITLGHDILQYIAEFKGRWQALKTISPERLQRLRKVATIESVVHLLVSRVQILPMYRWNRYF